MKLVSQLALLCGFVASFSCSSGAKTSSSMCGHAVGVDDGGAGACAVGRAALFCESPTAGGCDCVTNQESCENCTITPCVNKCHANEYAVSCGGPPSPNGSTVYASPPVGCRIVGSFPSGGAFSCCPCL